MSNYNLTRIAMFSMSTSSNSGVSVRVQLKGVWIDDVFLEDHLLSLGPFPRFGFGVTFDLVGIVYGDDSPFVVGDSDFVDDVALEKV